MVRDNRHDTAYILGAMCPARGVDAAIIALAGNIECINLHLAEISVHIAPGRRRRSDFGRRSLASERWRTRGPRQYRADPAAALRPT
jgi:hypothetical protein